MSDFIAHVIAELDTSKAQSQLNALTKGKHTVDIDVNLTSKNGNINTILNQIKSQFGSAGNAAGNNFANQFNSSIGNINTNNSVNTIKNLQRTLAGFKFDRSQINTITQSLDTMDIAVQKVETRIRQGGKLDLKVTGVDEIGRTVTVLKEFDSATGTLTNVGKNISQTFNQIASAGKAFTSTDVSKLSADISALDANFTKLKGSTNTYSAELASLKSDLAGIQNISGLDKQQEEFARITQEVTRLKAAYKEANAENRALVSSQQLVANKAILGNQITTWMNSNTKAARVYRTELDQLQKSLANVGNASELKAVSTAFNQLKTTAAASGNLGNSVFAKLKENLTSLSPLFGMGAMINTAIRGLKDMYSNVVDIDTALTELKKVTTESSAAYDQFMNTASKRSVELGTTIKDYVNSTADFARLGYSMNEAKELAEVANVYNVVGDEIESIDQASSSIISTLQAFGIEASSAMSIVDKFNEVGNRFAISSGGIGEALTRSASSMSAANNTLDETIALITAANTVVQNPEKVGNAFKTMSMRIRGAETELEEAGLDTEGMAESTAKLREEILALSGVDIMLDDNTFKSTYQIMDELSTKWKDLTDIQQASITELVAGKHQGNVMSSLMQNFDIARQALDVSLNSEGSAMAEHDKWMDSIQARVNQLKAAWEGLSQSFMGSDFLKGSISGLTSFVETIDTLIQKFGTIPTLAGGIAAALSFKNVGIFSTLNSDLDGFTNKFAIMKTSVSDLMNAFSAGRSGRGMSGFVNGLKSMGNAMSNSLTQTDIANIQAYNAAIDACVTPQTAWYRTMQNSSKAAQELVASANGGKVAMTGLTATTNTSKIAMIGLQAATVALNMALTMGIAFAIQALVTGLDNFVHSARNASQAADELTQESSQHITELENERNTIDELIQKYTELKQSDVQDTSTRSEIADIQSTITSLVGEQASNLDLVNGKLDEELGKLQDIQSQNAKDNLQDAVANYKNAKDSSEKAIGEDSFAFIDGYAYTGKREKNLEKVLKDAGYGGNVQPGGFFNNTLFVMDEFDNDMKQLENATQKAEYLKGMIETIENSGENYSDSSLYAGLKKQYDAYVEYADQQSQAANKLLEFATDYLQYDDKLSGMTVDSAESLQKYRDEMVNSIMDLPQLETAISDGLIDKDSVESYVDTWLGTIDKYSDYYSGIEDASGEASDIISQANMKITESAEEAATTVTDLITGITSAQEALGKQQNGKSISLADFNSEELKDYRGALEYVNGTMQLNADKVKEIAQAKAEEQIAINNTNKALEQTKYLENAKQIEQLRESLASASDSEKDAINSQINSLLAENSAIADACKQYDLLSASIQEAMGAYSNWLNSQNSSDYGDMANDALGAIKQIRDTYNEDSDIFGNFGSKKFDAAVDFIVPDSIDRDDLGAIESYMSDFKQYLTFDDSGNADGLNIDKFLENSVNAGLMSYSDDDGFKVLGGKKMEDFAEGLNMSSGMVQAFFDELQLKGADFDWGDEAVKTIGDLAIEANEAAESLRSMDGNSDLKIKMDVSDLATTEEQISALDATIAEMDAVKAKPDVDASSIENANAVIQYCLTQKQLLSQPDVMRVDTSQVEGDIANAISLLQQFQTAQNDLEIKQKVGADTSEAESKVQSLATEIQGLSPDIKAKLDIDSTSISSIQTSISSLSAETINVKANVDASAIEGYDPGTKKCEVIYNPETSALPTSFDAINRTVNYVPVTSSLPASFSTITRYVNYVKTGDVSVNGTAHAGGTARAGGDWGTAPGGRTLVGELGQEIVVDPHTGKWYTVGDNGAEFRDIPAGAIVFNHVQSKHLLENGYVSGRASALVSGTALVTGGYKPYKPSGGSTSTSNKSTASNNSSYKKPSSSSSASKKSYNSSSKSKSDDFEESVDFVEIALKRIGEAIDRLKVKAESTFKTLSKRNSAAADEIAMITQEIELQNSAYNKYMQQANAVGLSESWAKKVRDGSIEVSTITDKDLSEKIKDYQDFYEKAIECKDAVAELHEEIASLYADRFNNISSDFENQLSLIDHLTNTYNTGMDKLEAEGLLGSTKYYEALQKAEEQNIKILQQELVDLTESYNQAMDSGEIEKGSEQWYEMQKALNDVKEKIDESTVSMLEFQKSLRELDWSYFDFLQERISTITDESDFLIDLMSNGKLFDDKGNITDTGMATTGLHGQNYNVYMNQADQYAKEAEKLAGELAKDPTNTDLLERREELLELQREAILNAEDEKQAIVDLVQEGIDLQIDSMNELIDKYIESLENAQDLYEFQKKVKDQTTEIANLQKQLAAYKNDMSEEARAMKQKIEVDLSDAMEELQETEYDQYITDQKKLLDQLSIDYETFLNQRLDDVDALISDTIDSINSNSSDIMNTLKEESANVGYSMSDALNTIWSNEGGANSIITKYGDNFTAQLTTVNAALKICADYVTSLVNKANEEAAKKIENTKPTTPTTKPTTPTTKPPTTTPPKKTGTQGDGKIQVGDKVTFNSGSYYYSSDGLRPTGSKYRGKQVYVTKINTASWAKKPYHISTGSKLGSGDLGWLEKSQISGYASGLKKAKKDETAWVNELGAESIVSPTDRAITTHVSKGDTILNADATKNIWDMANDPSGFINGHLWQSGTLSGNGSTKNENNYSLENVNFNLPNVTNSDEFISELQKSNKFERMVQAMTVGRIAGGSKLDKYKYRK